MSYRKAIILTAAVVAVVGAASAFAAPTNQTATATKLTAFLTVNQEIPAPKGARGSGTFTATVSGRTIRFRLAFRGLTGAAAAAHIHLALAGRANPAPAVTLCGPCRSGQSMTVTATAAQMRTILGGGGYVNIHTPMNGAGEIRGQIASS
jgi:Cu/Zn superoxide dismutase